MTPTLGDGKICYIELPAKDAQHSAQFYEKVFGWRIRRRGDGVIAFDDGVGEVSGTWISGRSPAQGGLLVYIMVSSVAETLERLVTHGGELVQAVAPHAPEITARFRDPAGNVLGLYEHATNKV
jgi:predicted enzyme related to lactoylglutathione lyase